MNRVAACAYLLIVVIAVLVLTGCASTGRIDKEYEKFEALQTPPDSIRRTEAMPLVAAIPGLNLPNSPAGSQQFGQLIKMLTEDGIPAFVVTYNEKTYPLTAMAGLYSEEYSISLMRVVPYITNAVEKENEIRRSQGVGRLKNLDIVAYSQGSVLALDVLRYVGAFSWYWQKFTDDVGDEWKALWRDPEFQLFRDSADNYLAMSNINLQYQKQFERNFDARRFSERISDKLVRSFEKLRLYILSPEKAFPGATFYTGDAKGYPRRYPKIVKWFKENIPGEGGADILPFDFWIQYVEFEELLPLDMKLFSMSGSFFGSAEANKAYPLLEAMPGLGELMVGPVTEQIKDTQLGSRYHLRVMKDLVDYTEMVGVQEEIAEDVYFIVGAHGDKGDGLVSQSNAHFSSHLLTEIPLEDLLASLSQDARRFEYDRLPPLYVTGLDVYHLPKRVLFFFTRPGVAQMSEKSKVYPFLLEFLEEDFNKLSELHDLHNQELKQFMVSLALPLEDELKGLKVNLKTDSPHIKIKQRFYNGGSHTFVWKGVFTGEEDYFDARDAVNLRDKADVILTISEGSERATIKLEVNPGVNHFVEIAPRAKERRKYLESYLPRLYDLSSGEIVVEET